MLSLTLRQIEYGVAISRHGGVTAAAEALNVSQPALSVALREVERVLGQPLFLRRPGGRLVTTGFGREWLARAESQLAAVSDLIAARVEPPLRIAVFQDLAPIVLAPLMAGAEGRMEPQVMEFEPLVAALHEGRIDLGVTWDLGLDAGIGRIAVARIAPHAVLASAHPLAARDRLRLSDLNGEPLVLTDQGLSIAHMRTLFARAGLAPQIAHRTATIELMRSFAANGLGVGLSYSLPRSPTSSDGRSVITRPITDAGEEAVVLAFPEGAMPGAASSLAVQIRTLL